MEPGELQVKSGPWMDSAPRAVQTFKVFPCCCLQPKSMLMSEILSCIFLLPCGSISYKSF